nr:MAG: capsid protein [Cressdnaviricota sp.]
MPYVKKGNFKRKRATRKRAPRKASKNLVKLIQKQIHKDLEDKSRNVQLALTAYNSGITVAADATKVIPSISQGTDNGERIGDKVRGKSLVIRGHLLLSAPTISNQSNCRIGVRLMVVQPKRYSNDTDVTTYYNNWMPYLLDNGTTSNGFNGDIKDLYTPINRDAITVYYDKLHYLSSTNIVVLSSVGVANEDLRYTTKLFNIKIPCKKVLTYLDGNETPQNFAPMVILGYAKLDGSSADTLSANVSMAYTSCFKYEDA